MATQAPSLPAHSSDEMFAHTDLYARWDSGADALIGTAHPDAIKWDCPGAETNAVIWSECAQGWSYVNIKITGRSVNKHQVKGYGACWGVRVKITATGVDSEGESWSAVLNVRGQG